MRLIISLLLFAVFLLSSGTNVFGAEAKKKKAVKPEKKTAAKAVDPSSLDPAKVKKLGAIKMEKLVLLDSAVQRGNYIIMVVNLSDHQISQLRARKGATDGSHWIGFSPIGQTCEYVKTPDKCIQEKKWAPLVALDCGPTYDIDVLAKDPMGVSRMARAEKLQAACGTDGGVLIYKGGELSRK